MESENIFIIIPCFNEGQTIVQLLHEIEKILDENKIKCTAVVVDDCSTDNTLLLLKELSLKENLKLNILSLKFNHGHQGAIAQGLLFAQSNNAIKAIIMDGDGEDDPSAIPELLKLREYDIVHVVRGKRFEKLYFRLSYSLYRMAFRFLTRKKMNFGNYCLVSDKVIAVTCSRTFIHFAAFLSKLQFQSAYITSDRRQRIGGNSKMKLSSLVYHAFGSFVEYAQALLMVFLRLSVLLFIILMITVGYILYLKSFTTLAIPGWTSTFGIGLLTSALVCMGFFVTGVLLLNLSQNRTLTPPVPVYKIVR